MRDIVFTGGVVTFIFEDDERTQAMKEKKRPKITTIVLVGLLAGGVMEVFLGRRAIVSGTEFSPDLFIHRSFRYEVHAWLGIRLSSVETQEFRTTLEKYLNRQGYLPQFDGDKLRWAFVKGFRPGVKGWHGSAKYMCHALGCFSGESERWVDWSEKHPESAKILWPVIVDCMSREQFGKVVGIMFFVRDDPDISCSVLRNRIDLVLADNEW